MKTILHPWARFLVAMLFLMSGAGNLFAFKATVVRMGALGFSSPSFFPTCAIALDIAAGAYLLFASKAKRRRARSSS